MLIASESPEDFIKTLSSILESVKKPIDIARVMAEAAMGVATEADKSAVMVTDEGSRVLLKGTTLNFIGNLCVEPQLRQYIS